MAAHDVDPPDPHGPPEPHGPGDDLPPLDPRAVRHIEAALEELAGTAHPTAAGWDDVARRTQRRRRAQRRTQVAVAAAAVVLLIVGAAIAGRRDAPADLGTVGQPPPPTSAPSADDGLATTGTTSTAPGTSVVVAPSGSAPASAPPTTTAPPTSGPTTSAAPQPTTTTTVAPGPPVAIASDPDPLVQCQGFPGTFRPSLFTTPADADAGADPLSTALRTELARSRFDSYPDTGWRLAWADDSNALFIAGVPPFARVLSLRFADDRWQASSSGGCGALRVAPPEGTAWATWTIGARPPADASTFTLFVDDPSCSGTQSTGDRILPPRIEEHDDQVVITFTVTPLPPGGYTCIGHAATPYDVTLQRPIGDRALFDGGTWPARLEPS